MSYQYTGTLSDEAVKRYQSADFCFPFAETMSIKRIAYTSLYARNILQHLLK